MLLEGLKPWILVWKWTSLVLGLGHMQKKQSPEPLLLCSFPSTHTYAWSHLIGIFLKFGTGGENWKVPENSSTYNIIYEDVASAYIEFQTLNLFHNILFSLYNGKLHNTVPGKHSIHVYWE